MDALRPMIAYLIPVLLLELVLMFFAIRDLLGRPRLNGPKWLWVLIIVLVQVIGPIAYFVVGRRDE